MVARHHTNEFLALICLVVAVLRLVDAQAHCSAGSGGAGCPDCPVATWSSGGTIEDPQPACTRCRSGTTTLAVRSNSTHDCKGG